MSWLFWFFPFNKDLNNYDKLKCTQLKTHVRQQQPLSVLKISQTVKLIAKDGKTVAERKMNAQNIMLNAGNSFLNPLEFKIFLCGRGGGGGGGWGSLVMPEVSSFTTLKRAPFWKILPETLVSAADSCPHFIKTTFPNFNCVVPEKIHTHPMEGY